MLPDYDEMDKTGLSFPTYHETATKLQTNKMKGSQSISSIFNKSQLLIVNFSGPCYSEEEDTDARTKVQPGMYSQIPVPGNLLIDQLQPYQCPIVSLLKIIITYSTGDKPKLSELQLLKGRGGSRVRIIEGVAYKWKGLAMSVDFDGPRIESIDQGALRMSEEACRQMLVKWLDGNNDLRGAVTWDTLIQSLVDAGLDGYG